ncbi:hypothetical protein EDC01DRAFT_764503 [Geopyxis carbonaria]|nr:hypothetical protein EDC01DRAFT_764503 [Geopyxis carbonaria]
MPTPALLTTLRTLPHLPPHSWYYLASVALSLLNRPHDVPAVFSHALAHAGDAHAGDESAQRVFDKTREALLKACAVGGLPKTINALHALKKHPPCAPLLAHRPPTTRGADLDTAALARGDALWTSIYAATAPRVLAGMRASYPDLASVARVVYGHVLSEDAVLGAKETGLVMVAGLAVAGRAMAPQVKGHVRGALNNGATREEVAAVGRLAGCVVRWVREEEREEEERGEGWTGWGELPGLEEGWRKSGGGGDGGKS